MLIRRVELFQGWMARINEGFPLLVSGFHTAEIGETVFVSNQIRSLSSEEMLFLLGVLFVVTVTISMH